MFSGTDLKDSVKLIELIKNLIAHLGLPDTLSEMDIPESFLATLTEDTMLQTRLLINNPIELNYDSALAIYKAAY